MKRLFTAKPLLAAAVALGAIGAASAAHAGTDVVLRVGFAQPAYVAPAPVYVQTQPVYYGYTRYGDRSGPWGDADRDGVPNVYDRNSRWFDARLAQQHYRQTHRGWNDWDHDGVPNRFDHAPNNPYRR